VLAWASPTAVHLTPGGPGVRGTASKCGKPTLGHPLDIRSRPSATAPAHSPPSAPFVPSVPGHANGPLTDPAAVGRAAHNPVDEPLVP
jgi:hypothetical protein